MADLAHVWGNDLSWSPSGDIALVDGVVRAQQRILRRLLTNLNDYIWELDYGAGVPRYVGSTVDVEQITAVIRSQLMQETSVAKSPLPVIDISTFDGGITVNISFLNAELGVQDTLSFNYTV
jgi:hypothetical protein